MIICDTGIISRYLIQNKVIENIIENIIFIDNICITPLNKIELLNWLSGYYNLTKIDRAKYLKFINAIPIIHINEKVSKLAIELSNKNINSKPADTFIAAIAIYNKTGIYTANKKDFEVLKAPIYK